VIIANDPSPEEIRVFGGTIAAPIFSRIGARAMAYLDVTPSLPIEDTEVERPDVARAGD